jgi:hypothetical protein
MINGSYKIFKNGLEVCKSDNIVTTLGKDLLLKYITGTISSWGDSLAVGSGYDGSTAAAVTDTSLTFEVSRNFVNLKSPNISTTTTTVNGAASAGYTFVVTSATGIIVGMAVSGTNISPYAVVTNVSSTTITLSHAHTGLSNGATVIFTQRKIIFKTSLNPGLVATINEVGLFSFKDLNQSGNYDNDTLTKFDEGISTSTTNVGSWHYATGVSTSTATSKVGTSNIVLTNSFAKLGTTETLALYSTDLTYPGSLNLDFTSYNRADTIQLAVISPSGTTASGTIEVTFYDNQPTPGVLKWTISADTYTATTTKIKKAVLSSLTSSGDFNYNISAIKIYTPLTLSFDALRVERTSDLSTIAGLVSRSVLSSPITKALGDSLDIQYELNLGI